MPGYDTILSISTVKNAEPMGTRKLSQPRMEIASSIVATVATIMANIRFPITESPVRPQGTNMINASAKVVMSIAILPSMLRVSSSIVYLPLPY